MATDIKFTATETMYNNKKIGEVLYKNQTIMRLMEKGEFLTPFARAQIVAYRLNENIKTINDVKDIIYRYPNDVYTAYINNNKLFSIYIDEVKYNGSTPEGLMGSWINNLKRVMIVDGIPEVNDKKPEPIEIPKESKKKEAVIATDKMAPETVGSIDEKMISEKSTGVDIVEINDLKEQIKKLQKQVSKPVKASNSIIVFVVVGINIVFSLVLIVLYLKVRKRLGIYSQLEKTENLEELENTVSVLIKELQGTSETVTEKAQNVMKELDNKIAGAAHITVQQKQETSDQPKVASAVKPQSQTPKKPIVQTIPEVPEVEIPQETSKLENLLREEMEKDQNEKVEIVPEANEIEPPPVVEETKAPPVVEEKPIAEQLAEEIEKQLEEDTGKDSSTDSDGGEEDEFEMELRKEMDGIKSNEALTQNEKVVQLASMNVMQEDIAKELSMGVGEVELILQLNK